MALKLSTGLVNALLSKPPTVAAMLGGITLAFADGGAGEDSITDSDNGLVTAGFEAGQFVTIFDPTTAANKTGLDGAQITAAAAGAINFATGLVGTAEAFKATTMVIAATGGAWRDVFHNGVLRIYSGSQPADADAAETGTMLCELTLSSGAFTPGSPTNGLRFGAAAAGVISKLSGQVWSGVNAASGTAGWFRLYDNAQTTGASTTGVRLDGGVGTSGTTLIVSSTSMTISATTTIDTAAFTLPTA